MIVGVVVVAVVVTVVMVVGVFVVAVVGAVVRFRQTVVNLLFEVVVWVKVLALVDHGVVVKAATKRMCCMCGVCGE